MKCTRLEEEKKILTLKYEEETTEVTSKSVNQLKTLREQFESDRLDLRMTIDKLQKEKVDLQAEIGQLLRDRRTFVTELYQKDPRLAKLY